MDRREAISIVGLIVGGSVVGVGNFLSSCTPKDGETIYGILDKQQVKTIEEVAETILPKTKDSPGAKDVEIGKFVNRFITDCYDNEEQKTLLDGIIKLNELSVSVFNDYFADLKSKEKHELLLTLETEVKTFYDDSENWDKKHYYSMMKQATILGYLTSERVGTEVYNYVPIPGRFEGCIQYTKGKKSFI